MYLDAEALAAPVQIFDYQSVTVRRRIESEKEIARIRIHEYSMYKMIKLK